MLINFEYYLNNPNIMHFDIKAPNMRMPFEIEKKTIKKFDNYKKKKIKDV